MSESSSARSFEVLASNPLSIDERPKRDPAMQGIA